MKNVNIKEEKKTMNLKNQIILDLNKEIDYYEIFVNMIVLNQGKLEYKKYHFYVDSNQIQKIIENPIKDYENIGVNENEIIYVFLQYIPIYWHNGLEIINYNQSKYLYEFSNKYEKYKKQISKEFNTFLEMEYVNIKYNENKGGE
ncbi:MAG: hypothetical protein QW046_01895 [Candidatus Micrarchaeaceae archaeon]